MREPVRGADEEGGESQPRIERRALESAIARAQRHGQRRHFSPLAAPYGFWRNNSFGWSLPKCGCLTGIRRDRPRPTRTSRVSARNRSNATGANCAGSASPPSGGRSPHQALKLDPLNQLANTSSPNSARSRLLTRPHASPEDATCSCCATVLLLLHCSRSRRYAPHASYLSSQQVDADTMSVIAQGFPLTLQPGSRTLSITKGAAMPQIVERSFETARDVVARRIPSLSQRSGGCQAPATRTANKIEIVLGCTPSVLSSPRGARQSAQPRSDRERLPFDKNSRLPIGASRESDIGPLRAGAHVDELRDAGLSEAFHAAVTSTSSTMPIGPWLLKGHFASRSQATLKKNWNVATNMWWLRRTVHKAPHRLLVNCLQLSHNWTIETRQVRPGCSQVPYAQL
jgi:hypothetical protein